MKICWIKQDEAIIGKDQRFILTISNPFIVQHGAEVLSYLYDTEVGNKWLSTCNPYAYTTRHSDGTREFKLGIDVSAASAAAHREYLVNSLEQLDKHIDMPDDAFLSVELVVIEYENYRESDPSVYNGLVKKYIRMLTGQVPHCCDYDIDPGIVASNAAAKKLFGYLYTHGQIHQFLLLLDALMYGSTGVHGSFVWCSCIVHLYPEGEETQRQLFYKYGDRYYDAVDHWGYDADGLKEIGWHVMEDQIATIDQLYLNTNTIPNTLVVPPVDARWEE